MNRYWMNVYWIGLCSTVLCAPLWAAEPLRLENLQKLALERNPELKAAYQAWKVSEDQVGPAGTWPAPTFGYIDEKQPSGVTGVEPIPMRHLNVQQTIPFPGKLTQEARMKRHDALLTGARYQSARLEVLGELRRRFYQLYLTERSSDLAEQSVAILKRMLGAAQARLAAGQASAADVFMAQTELRRMENMAFEQKQERLIIQAELNTLVNQPVDTELGPASPPATEDLPLSLTDAQTLALHYNPEVQSGHHEVGHSRAMLSRGRLAFAPDFGLMYERETSDAGPAGRQIGVSITLPLWFGKPWGDYEAAKQHVLEAENVQTDRENKVRQMVYQSYTETQTHLTMVRNHQAGILPSAQSSLTIVRQQYVSGEADFIRFLEALRGWIGANLDYEKELYRYGESLTDLERWVGTELAQGKPLSEVHHEH